MKLCELKKRQRFILVRTGQKFEVLDDSGNRRRVKPFDSDIHSLHCTVEVKRLKKPLPSKKFSALNQHAAVILEKLEAGETYMSILIWLRQEHNIYREESSLRSYVCKYRKHLRDCE